MSTILNALKKSEQQRNLGSVPKLGRPRVFAPPPPPRPRRPLWPWLVGGASLLNATALAGVVWWLSAGPGADRLVQGAALAPPAPVSETPAEPTPAPPPVAESTPAGGAVLSDTAPPAELAQASPQASGAQAAEPALVTAAAPLSQPEAADIQVALAAAGETGPALSGLGATPTVATARARAFRDPAPADPTPVRAEAPPVLADLPPPVEVQQAVVVPPRKPEVAPDPEPAPDPYFSLPGLFQLPRGIQEAIPDLPITVHVYDENVDNRFVIVQRRKYREGDRFSSDLTLEAIAPLGLVLRYQDTAFRLDL